MKRQSVALGRNTQEAIYYNRPLNSGGFTSRGTSSREMPKLHEEDRESLQNQPASLFGSKNSGKEKSNCSKYNGFSASRIFSSTISNASSTRASRPSTFDHDTMALRKRSTSLPDGEKLNLEFVDAGVTNNSVPAIPHNIDEPALLFRRGSVFDGYSSQSESPSHSQYPSYRDLTSGPHLRKRGMATVYPIRKRSLSCGDAIQVKMNEARPVGTITTSVSPRPWIRPFDRWTTTSEALTPTPDETIYQEDDEHALIGNAFITINESPGTEDGLQSCRQPRRKSKHSFLRDPSPLAKRFRDASPFGKKKPFWSSTRRNEHTSSPAVSISRLFRKIRGGGSGNEYSDLSLYCDDEEGVGHGVFEMDEITGNGVQSHDRQMANRKRSNDSISSLPYDDCCTLTDNSEPLLAIPSSSAGDSSLSASLSCS